VIGYQEESPAAQDPFLNDIDLSDGERGCGTFVHGCSLVGTIRIGDDNDVCRGQPVEAERERVRCHVESRIDQEIDQRAISARRGRHDVMVRLIEHHAVRRRRLRGGHSD
jgi:hypothetical protein